MRLPAAWLLTAALLGVQHTAKGAQNMGPKRELPDDTLFNDPAVFCEGCYGMVQELYKLMEMWGKEKGSLEDHIDAALLAVCSTDRLRAYVLSPPKMMRLCSGIRAHYEDDLGLALLTHYSAKKRANVDKIFESVCRKAIPACPRNTKPMSVARQEKREKETNEPNKKDKKMKTETKEVKIERKSSSEKKKDEL